jgi:hypothetical protein
MKNTLISRISFAAILAVALGTLAVKTQAQVISWNFDVNGTVSGAGDSAGVVLANNWNNSWPSNPTTGLIDNSGTATTLNLSYGPTAYAWSIQGSHPGQDADGSYNRELLNGYLNDGPATWNPPITSSFVTLTSIPYAQYDIYVYFSSDAAGRTATVSDGATTYSLSTVGAASISGANAVFIQTTDTGTLYPTANYAVFSGLTGSSQTITESPLVNDAWSGIAGFQIVAVPEPGVMALAGIGGLGLLLMGRRTRRSGCDR